MTSRSLYSVALVFLSFGAFAQTTPSSSEKTPLSGLINAASTTIGGYGNAFYQRNANSSTAEINLERFVLFVGHKFSSKLTLFSELEIEDAKIAGGENGGEIALEQAYLKFDISKGAYLVGGLFLPRLGILNEDHLPTAFNGNERPIVETLVIPATWRELGVGFYAGLESVPLEFSVALVNGLNASGFEHGTGIREGRFEGRNATANNLAVNGSIRYNADPVRLQVSGYYGGSVGYSHRQADSLQLSSGPFGSPVAIVEADVGIAAGGFQCKLLGTYLTIPDAEAINHAFASNTPNGAYGAYAEAGYDLFRLIPDIHGQQLIAFARCEKLDLNSTIPSNGIHDGTLDQTHFIVGLTYLPDPGVVLKADVHFVHTVPQNSDLIVNPSPAALPYQQNNTFVAAGIGFAF